MKCIDASLLVGLEVLAGLVGDAADEDEGEDDDGGLLEADAAEEEAADEDGQVGEGGAEVGLLEDEEHGDGTRAKALPMSVQVSSRPARPQK